MNYVLFTSTFIKLFIRGIFYSNKRHTTELFFFYIHDQMIKERMTTNRFHLNIISTEIMDLIYPRRNEFLCIQLNNIKESIITDKKNDLVNMYFCT